MDNFDKVNLILSEWDPFDVGDPISLDEYKKYVPRIVKVLNDEIELKKCLINIMENELGLDYSHESDIHSYYLKELVDRLMNVTK